MGRLTRLRLTYLRTEAAGGTLLLVGAAVALIWANSPWQASHGDVWTSDVRHIVNEGLMALFFLVIGLEVKRELVAGELQEWRTAALPAVAALGGMVVPALLYSLVNTGGPGARGWGVPMATDIAFAVGVLSLLGRRVPASLKLFLVTLAVVDDIGAIVLIAIFYSDSISGGALAVAAALAGVVVALGRFGVTALIAYAVVGAALWLAVYQSGVHATIAGAALGLLAPAAVAERWESALQPMVSFAVLPLFALANAGVILDGDVLDVPGAGAVAAGVVLGLVVGKCVGILSFAWLAVRTGMGSLPRGTTWPQVAGVAVTAGIGFTVSLFITELAFGADGLQAAAKVGVLAASAIAALLGIVIVRWATPAATSS